MSEQKKAFEYLKQAQKKVKGWSLFGNKYEKAVELFESAANLFKVAENYEEAASAFLCAADCHRQLKSPHDAASALVEAANAYKRFDPQKAVETLVEASSLNIEMGRVNNAAKYHMEIGEIFEKELELDKAVEAYENACRYYTNAEQPSWANKARNAMAHLLAKTESYRRAITAFEELGNSVLDTPSRFSAREYFFKAGLCQFCHAAAGNQDIQNIRIALEDYDNKDVTFQDQREYKFLMDLLRAYEDFNLDAFEDAVQDYDNLSRLGDWEMGLLLHVREAIARGPSLT